MIEHKYKIFWERFAAGIIDCFLFLPFVIIEESLFSDNYLMLVCSGLAQTVLYTIYVIIGHGKYGQTIGKRVMKIKVLDISENKLIGYKRAFIRESVWFFLSLLLPVYFLIKIDSVPANEVEDRFFSYEDGSSLIYFGWFLVELITMLTNRKRRAVHDYMANSVVVKV